MLISPPVCFTPWNCFSYLYYTTERPLAQEVSPIGFLLHFAFNDCLACCIEPKATHSPSRCCLASAQHESLPAASSPPAHVFLFLRYSQGTAPRSPAWQGLRICRASRRVGILLKRKGKCEHRQSPCAQAHQRLYLHASETDIGYRPTSRAVRRFKGAGALQ